jgi:hypothetical protein
MKHLDKSAVRAVYDVTLAIPGDQASTVSTVLMGQKSVGHMYLRRFDVDKLPTGESGFLKVYLHEQ